MLRFINILLSVAFLIVVVAIVFLKRDYTSPNSEFIPGMVVSVPYNAQDENPNFPDGKTLQLPPPGTIAGNFFPFHYQANADDAKRAGEELTNPLSDTLESEVGRGAIVFANICSPCHGAGGLGDGTVAKRGFPPPPSLLADKAKNMKDGQLFHIMTYGQANMPSLASQVLPLDRWRVIKYVRSLQQPTLAAGH